MRAERIVYHCEVSPGHGKVATDAKPIDIISEAVVLFQEDRFVKTSRGVAVFAEPVPKGRLVWTGDGRGEIVHRNGRTRTTDAASGGLFLEGGIETIHVQNGSTPVGPRRADLAAERGIEEGTQSGSTENRRTNGFGCVHRFSTMIICRRWRFLRWISLSRADGRILKDGTAVVDGVRAVRVDGLPGVDFVEAGVDIVRGFHFGSRFADAAEGGHQRDRCQ